MNMQLTSQVKSAIGTALAAGGGHTASASERALTRANQTLASLGDAIAILGMAQQENLRRFLFLSFFFFFFFFDSVSAPKDIASIYQNEDLPVKDKLFSGDVEKAIKSAREAHKYSNKSTPSMSGQRHHSYKRQQYGRPFFLGQSGQSGTPFKGYHSQRGRVQNKQQGLENTGGSSGCIPERGSFAREFNG